MRNNKKYCHGKLQARVAIKKEELWMMKIGFYVSAVFKLRFNIRNPTLHVSPKRASLLFAYKTPLKIGFRNL